MVYIVPCARRSHAPPVDTGRVLSNVGTPRSLALIGRTVMWGFRLAVLPTAMSGASPALAAGFGRHGR